MKNNFFKYFNMDIFEEVVTYYQEVVREGIDINTSEPVRKMFVELTEKHSKSIKDRLRYTTQTQSERDDDEDSPITIAKKLSGCTGFATYVMAEYIQKKYKTNIDKIVRDFVFDNEFSDIFNTYPGSLIYGITQQEIDRQNQTDPDYMNYTFEKVGLKPGLNLVQVCTKSTKSTLTAFGFFPVHTFLVYLEEETALDVYLATSWFSGEAEDTATPPKLNRINKTELFTFLNAIVSSPENKLNDLVKHFFGDANYFDFSKEGDVRTFEVFVFNEVFFSTRLGLLRASGGYRKMKKRKRKSTLKRRKRPSTKRKKRNQIKKRTKKRDSHSK